MEPVTLTREPDLDELRRRRAELFASVKSLRQALDSPSPPDPDGWIAQVRTALDSLIADFHTHVEITEGPGGLYGDVIVTAPRLSRAVERLVSEHDMISALLQDLVAHAARAQSAQLIAELRQRGNVLLDRMARHRQRGADLVYEAYETDIGGET